MAKTNKCSLWKKKISTKSVEAYICSYSKLYMSVGVAWYQSTSSVYFYFLLSKILSFPFGLWFSIDKIFTHDRIDFEIIPVFKVGISITAEKTGIFPMQEQHRERWFWVLFPKNCRYLKSDWWLIENCMNTIPRICFHQQVFCD